MISKFSRLAGAALALVLMGGAATQGSAADPEKASSTVSMQGGEQAWINDPHTHQLYALTVAAFANGPKAVDKARYEADAVAIFRDFGRATGVGADAMADHLKLIPDQVIQIATEDPKVLASYDNFIRAVFGPQ
jgi:hypothetical protein